MLTTKELLEQGKIEEAFKQLTVKANVKEYAKEYEGDRTLRANQVGKRKDKKLKKEVVTVAKIPIPFQRRIVQSGGAFLFGNPVKITSEDDRLEVVKDIWDKNRIDAMLLKMAETVKSETEATLIFYPVENAKGVSIKVRLLSSENGQYYPVFDEYGDMVAFCWRYKVLKGGKEKEYIQIFTDEFTFIYAKDRTWILEDKKTNLFGKIPVVYMCQSRPDWWDVRHLIDRYEMNLSKFADTNDYFASPMYKAKGGVKSIPQKDDTGKIIKLDIIETDSGKIIEADLDVIAWDRAPEALELEFKIEEKLIYGMTDTVDWAHLREVGIGNVSGVALELMFFGSILKAKREEGEYRTAVSRILNILKAGAEKVLNKGDFSDMEFKIDFTSVLPDNIRETVETLYTATGGRPFVSQETATAMNPFVTNPVEEIARLKSEAVVDVFNRYE